MICFVWSSFAVMEDLQFISKRHYQDLGDLIKQGQIPGISPAAATGKPVNRASSRTDTGQRQSRNGHTGADPYSSQPLDGSRIEYSSAKSGSVFGTHGYQYKTGML